MRESCLVKNFYSLSAMTAIITTSQRARGKEKKKKVSCCLSSQCSTACSHCKPGYTTNHNLGKRKMHYSNCLNSHFIVTAHFTNEVRKRKHLYFSIDMTCFRITIPLCLLHFFLFTLFNVDK